MELRLVEELYQALEEFPLVDPHTHIQPLQPVARSLDDILGYHYYTELAHSAGLDKRLLAADVEPQLRVRALAEYLPALENTVQYTWLEFIVRELVGFECERIGPENIDAVWQACDRAFQRADWTETVIRRSRLVCVFLTNDFDDPLDGFDTAFYVPCLRTDELVFRLAELSVRERLAEATNVEVTDAASLERALGALFEHFVERGARACAISLPPRFHPAPVTGGEVAPALDRLLRTRHPLPADREQVSRFVFWTLARLCDDFRLPFDLMIGVYRNVYREGVYQGQDLLDSRWSLYQYAELFNAFPNVTFPISVLSHSLNPELMAFAWIFPNVVAHGHWWYANVPPYIRIDLSARLTAVPAVKQIGYYSDAYRLEFVLPKFAMYRRVLAEVLAEQFVIGRGWTAERAVRLAWQILVESPCRIFGIPLPESHDLPVTAGRRQQR